MQPNSIEFSLVMPCLNEEQSVGECVKKAKMAFKRYGMNGEIIVVDNGSTDNSADIAKKEGAIVVAEPVRGYGSAYLGGIKNARGKYIIMGDADNQHDFFEMDKFVNRLREGYEFISGTRLKGNIKEGAMSWLHRYIGNPGLTWLLKVFFKYGFSDAYCGYKAFTKDAYNRMKPLSRGMEFCLELGIRSSLLDLNRTEVPVTMSAREGKTKLRTFRDGWRSLRFILLFSPNYLFLLPGTILFAVGAALLYWAKNFNTIMLGSLGMILGFQTLVMWLFAKEYSFIEGYTRKAEFFKKFYKYCNLERGIILGVLLFAAGLAINFYFLPQGFNYAGSLIATKWFFSGFMMIIFGIQIVLASFFISLLGLKDKDVI